MVSFRHARVGAMAPFSTTLGCRMRRISTCWGCTVPSDCVLFDNRHERDDVTGGSHMTTSALDVLGSADQLRQRHRRPGLSAEPGMWRSVCIRHGRGPVRGGCVLHPNPVRTPWSQKAVFPTEPSRVLPPRQELSVMTTR